MWWMAAQGALTGWLGGSVNRAITQANNRIAKANADADNLVRRESNVAAAAQNNLARWVQSVNNNRRLAAGGEAAEASLINFYRAADAEVNQGIARGVRASEAAGMAAASAAFNGIDGSVVDMVNTSTQLRTAMMEEEVRKNSDLVRYDQARRQGAIAANMVSGLDTSLIWDNLDYGKSVAQVQATTSPFQDALRGAIPGLMQMAANYMQTPKAEGPRAGAFKAPEGNFVTSTYDFGTLPPDLPTFSFKERDLAGTPFSLFSR